MNPKKARVWPDEVIKAAKRAVKVVIVDSLAHTPQVLIEKSELIARAALSAAGDALEGAILAPVTALADRADARAIENGANDHPMILASDLRAVLADPGAAVAKHNEAIRADEREQIAQDTSRGCARCRHSSNDHRLDDATNVSPVDPMALFRCVVDGCDCFNFRSARDVLDAARTTEGAAEHGDGQCANPDCRMCWGPDLTARTAEGATDADNSPHCTCGAIEYGGMVQHLVPCPLARTGGEEGT